MNIPSLPFIPILLMAALLMSTSCKKKNDPTTIVEGKVYNKDTGKRLDGAIVKVWFETCSGMFGPCTSSYVAASAITGGDGTYRLSFEAYSGSDAHRYIIMAEREGYGFTSDNGLNYIVVERGKKQTIDFAMQTENVFISKLRNVYPYSEHDTLDVIYYYKNTLNIADSMHVVVLNNTNQVKTYSLNTTGNSYIKIKAESRSGGVVTSYSDSIFRPNNETAFHYLAY